MVDGTFSPASSMAASLDMAAKKRYDAHRGRVELPWIDVVTMEPLGQETSFFFSDELRRISLASMLPLLSLCVHVRLDKAMVDVAARKLRVYLGEMHLDGAFASRLV